MKKIDLKKLENLMIKNYKRQISFQELQKNFFENDIERIEYIKSELEKAYIEKNEKIDSGLFSIIRADLSPFSISKKSE